MWTRAGVQRLEIKVVKINKEYETNEKCTRVLSDGWMWDKMDRCKQRQSDFSEIISHKTDSLSVTFRKPSQRSWSFYYIYFLSCQICWVKRYKFGALNVDVNFSKSVWYLLRWFTMWCECEKIWLFQRAFCKNFLSFLLLLSWSCEDVHLKIEWQKHFDNCLTCVKCGMCCDGLNDLNPFSYCPILNYPCTIATNDAFAVLSSGDKHFHEKR